MSVGVCVPSVPPSDVSPDIKRTYQLLAGLFPGDPACAGLPWDCALGAHLWYGASAPASLHAVLESYQSALSR